MYSEEASVGEAAGFLFLRKRLPVIVGKRTAARNREANSFPCRSRPTVTPQRQEELSHESPRHQTEGAWNAPWAVTNRPSLKLICHQQFATCNLQSEIRNPSPSLAKPRLHLQRRPNRDLNIPQLDPAREKRKKRNHPPLELLQPRLQKAPRQIHHHRIAIERQ